MDVTLIVKASNQQCEDLTIKCEPSWTIRRLKGHLTEVYPGKPSSDEQKLIYSGQLLSDSVVLKDVLRQYDGQQTHTVHLVFTPKNSYYGHGGSSGAASKASNKSNTGSKMATNSSSTSTGGAGTGGGAGSPGVSGVGSSTSNTSAAGASSREREETTVDGIGSDGLRQRTLLQTRPGLRTMPGPPPFMEQTVALQSLMQQTYMQYLNQYINMINEQNGINALYSATGVPPAGGAATPMNPLTGSPVIPSVPFVPVTQSPGAVGTFPNFAYYPCMTAASHVGGLPAASSIPTSIASAAGAGGSASVLPGTAPGASFLPSPSIPSTSGTSQQASSPTSLLPGAETPTLPPSSATDAGAPSTAAVAVQTPPGTEATAAAPAQGAPQDAAVAEAAAPARARRFPNIVVEEQENNDWLDVFFSMCRVGILMTVIYLYSSPMRCLTVLFIGVMLYLKKHLDRVYQAIDRRLTRLPAPQEGNAAQPAVAQPNNNVPDQQAPPQVQRPEQDPRDAVIATEEQPATAAGSPPASDVTPITERTETEGDVAGPSTSQSAPVPRPRTGPASRAAEANVVAGNHETEPLLERTPTTGSDSTPAEQPAAEGQRMTFNDMTSFLGTLVITFFTSIIPDTPAA
uniref:Ubiquitin-like domain-containing protein n=1 Tax=Anopheles atroparvus TaxID=41427 RepID=A0AAG5DJ43_ANOAO